MPGPRPFVLLSAAMSLDGFLDDASPERLLLSGAADFDRVDAERAASDAVLVGGNTLRADNPRLLVNDPGRRAARLAAGRPEYPLKVTLSASGRLDRALRFWHTGGERLAYSTDAGAAALRPELAGLAEVVALGATVELGAVLDDLGARGVRRLMVEGGSGVHTQFLAQGLADELQLVVAPLLVGQERAPRFVGPADFPGGPARRMRLLEARTVGDVVLLRYAPKEPAPVTEPHPVNAAATGPGAPAGADLRHLRRAVELSRRCPPSRTAFSVGAVVVAADGTVLAEGFSREADAHDHAEEAALGKLPAGDPRLRGATVYSSLEPCGQRASRPVPCAELLIAAGVPRVVVAWREPATFVAETRGAGLLEAAGIEVVELPELAEEARAVNAHLPG